MNHFLKEIRKYQLLNREEEKELARKIHNGDESAIQQLVQANLRFVVSVAKKYIGSGLQLEDLVNEGSIGLIEAAKRFNPDKGVKFITYAVWWVRQAILFAIASKAGIVKLPANQARILNKINREKHRLTQKMDREPTISELADKMGIEESEIEDLFRATRISLPIDSQSDNGEGHHITLEDESTHVAENHVIKDFFVDDVDLLLTCLNEREKEILEMHFGFKGEHFTLQQIGDKFGLTRERIRKIEKGAIRKLKRIATKRNLHDYLR